MKMNKLSFIKRFTFAVLSLLITANLWGQATLSGSGTEESPYLITSAADWNIFANEANAATYWKIGKYVRLDADITVTTMVGTNSNKYRGTFDGNWHTLTLDISSSADYAAPFSYINGASIKKLKIGGSVTTSAKYAGSLVGSVNGNNTITSCTSTANINISTNGDASTGGLAGRVWEKSNDKLIFNNCSFEGNIIGSNAIKCAGFVGWVAGTVGYTNCLMAGTISIKSEKPNVSTFNRKADNAVIESIDNTYYITSYNDLEGNTFQGPDGSEAPQDAPTTVIGKKYTKNTTTYYVPGAAIITDFATTYSYTGNNIVVTLTLTYYGWKMTQGTDYEFSYEKKNGDNWESVAVIKDEGDYRIIISGKVNYAGSYTSPTIQVLEFKSWSDVKSILADASQGNRNITLSGDIYPANPSGADVTLEVNGTVILNLGGHIIDRKLFSVSPIAEPVVKGQVIRINSGANLTINGPGTIKGGYNKAENSTENGDNNDGGGIYNKGTLVINNVVVTDNKCVKYDINSIERTARGGGVYNGSGSSFTMTGGKITCNECLGGGGGIYCNTASVFSMDGVEVSGNISESKGGGIRVKTSGDVTATLSNCNIEMNFATGNSNIDGGAAEGGGVYMEAGNLNLDNCSICGNQSTFAGAGLYSHNGSINAKQCNIYWNGTYYESDKMAGGGVYLNNPSVYTMDGGSIYENNSYQDGGGIYVKEGAAFKVKGNVKIYDSYKAGISMGGTNNNAYLNGTAVIEVIEPLIEDAIINITPHGSGGVAVVFAEGAASEIPAENLSHFTLDGSDYNLIIDKNGSIESYVPYAWDNAGTWNGTIATNLNGEIPDGSTSITIHRAVKIPKNVVAEAGSITCDAFCNIIIEDGAQLITNSTGVAVLAKKEIVAADADAHTGWYLVSSPVVTASITEATNLITTGSQKYDLYRFNEAVELQWENYRADHADFTTLQNGRGYLYRNADNHKINIDGTLNVSDVTYNLSCSGSGELKGFNLIGNPYSQNITLLNTTLVDNNSEAISTQLTGFYRLTANGSTWTSEITSGDAATIAPLEGFLVQVDEPRTVKFSRTPRGGSKSNGDNIKFTVANSQYEDVAYALFENGLGLNKIEHMNEDVPMVYININKEDFAIATLNDEVKQFNLNFEAKTTGRYTLKVEKTGAYRYLHLIDKVAEKDINLLEENEYSFIGSPADSKDRFIVRLENTADAENPVFAYQNGSDIVVCGEGELQVFDVMGRLIAQKHVNGVETMCTSSLKTGVYVFRLNDMTQKIVIR